MVRFRSHADILGSIRRWPIWELEKAMGSIAEDGSSVIRMEVAGFPSIL
jgi:hypothetical protein